MNVKWCSVDGDNDDVDNNIHFIRSYQFLNNKVYITCNYILL